VWNEKKFALTAIGLELNTGGKFIQWTTYNSSFAWARNPSMQNMWKTYDQQNGVRWQVQKITSSKRSLTHDPTHREARIF